MSRRPARQPAPYPADTLAARERPGDGRPDGTPEGPKEGPKEGLDVPAGPRGTGGAGAVPGSAVIVGTNGPIGQLRGLVGGAGRLTLAVPRGRGLPSIDVVEFTAACPACGRDVQWIEEREETRLRIIVECPCTR